MDSRLVRTVELSLSPLERVKAMWRNMADDSAWTAFDTAMWKSLELEEVDEKRQRVSFTMTVTDALLNRNETLHGGAAGMILDSITTFAILTISREGFWENTGVSRSLSTVFLRPVFKETKIRIEGEVVHAGKKTACLSGRISRLNDGKAAVTCIHDKVPLEIKSSM